MERESLLSLLVLLLGGLSLMLVGLLRSLLELAPRGRGKDAAPWAAAGDRRRGVPASALAAERSAWMQLCWPVVPALLVAAALCGWALTEPDPVPQRVGIAVLIAACAPFALPIGRALLRAVWSLQQPRDVVVSTVGLIQPQIIFSPFLARQLDVRVLRAALAHECAHVRHRDPLRIWLGQLLCDLQWPWPGARRRLATWLAALERARDEDARTRGVEGADLADAVLAAMRFGREAGVASPPAPCVDGANGGCAALTGQEAALRARIAALLAPLPASAAASRMSARRWRVAGALLAAVLASLVLGALFGPGLIGPLLGLT